MQADYAREVNVFEWKTYLLPGRENYWGSYFKYKKSWLSAFWSLGAGVFAGVPLPDVDGGVRFGTCKLVSLQGVAARFLWQWVPLAGASAECRSKDVCARAVWSFGADALRFFSTNLGRGVPCALWGLYWCHCMVPLPDVCGTVALKSSRGCCRVWLPDHGNKALCACGGW